MVGRMPRWGMSRGWSEIQKCEIGWHCRCNCNYRERLETSFVTSYVFVFRVSMRHRRWLISCNNSLVPSCIVIRLKRQYRRSSRCFCSRPSSYLTTHSASIPAEAEWWRCNGRWKRSEHTAVRRHFPTHKISRSLRIAERFLSHYVVSSAMKNWRKRTVPPPGGCPILETIKQLEKRRPFNISIAWLSTWLQSTAYLAFTHYFWRPSVTHRHATVLGSAGSSRQERPSPDVALHIFASIAWYRQFCLRGNSERIKAPTASGPLSLFSRQ